MTWQHYLTDDRDSLEARWVELSEESASRAEELGIVQAEEKRARVDGFRNSESTSISGREWDASLEAVSYTTEYLKLRSELEALREERDLVRSVLDARSEP